MERRAGHARVVTSLPDSAGPPERGENAALSERWRASGTSMRTSCQAWGTTGQIFRSTRTPAARARSRGGGVIAQHLVCANVDGEAVAGLGDQRREGREWIAGIGVTEIVARRVGNACTMKHGAAVVVGANGLAGGGKSGPWKKARRQRGAERPRRAARA